MSGRTPKMVEVELLEEGDLFCFDGATYRMEWINGWSADAVEIFDRNGKPANHQKKFNLMTRVMRVQMATIVVE